MVLNGHAARDALVGAAFHDDGVDDPATCRGQQVWDWRRPLRWNVSPMLDLSSWPARNDQRITRIKAKQDLVIAGSVDDSNISPGLCNVQDNLNVWMTQDYLDFWTSPGWSTAQWAGALAPVFYSWALYIMTWALYIIIHQWPTFSPGLKYSQRQQRTSWAWECSVVWWLLHLFICLISAACSNLLWQCYVGWVKIRNVHGLNVKSSQWSWQTNSANATGAGTKQT